MFQKKPIVSMKIPIAGTLGCVKRTAGSANKNPDPTLSKCGTSCNFLVHVTTERTKNDEERTHINVKINIAKIREIADRLKKSTAYVTSVSSKSGSTW